MAPPKAGINLAIVVLMTDIAPTFVLVVGLVAVQGHAANRSRDSGSGETGRRRRSTSNGLGRPGAASGRRLLNTERFGSDHEGFSICRGMQQAAVGEPILGRLKMIGGTRHWHFYLDDEVSCSVAVRCMQRRCSSRMQDV